MEERHQPRLHDYPMCPPASFTGDQCWAGESHSPGVYAQHLDMQYNGGTDRDTQNFTMTEDLRFRTRVCSLEVMALMKMHCVTPDIIFKSHSFEPIISTYEFFFRADFTRSSRHPGSQSQDMGPGQGRLSRGLPLCLSVGLTVQPRAGSQKTVHWRQNASLTIGFK